MSNDTKTNIKTYECVLQLNSSTTAEEVKALDRSGLIKRNLNKAIVKDTVNVPDGGYTIIRFHANNPGTNYHIKRPFLQLRREI